MSEPSLRGVVDMHVHTNPDLRLRAYDDFALCDAAVREGARAIVIKSHLGSTAERAYLTNRYNLLTHGENDFTMVGSVTLNRCVGGINPEAVDHALRLGARVVWLPTQSSRWHLERTGRPTDGAVDVVRGGRAVPELLDVLRLIREHDAVLATGHISPEETRTVAEAARAAGVEKIVVTHPEWWLVGMSEEEQIFLAREYGIVLERCFAQNMGGGRYRRNLPDTLRFIRRAGAGCVLLSTDGGQTENPLWQDAARMTLRYLSDNGVSAQELRYMTHDLPCRLLGLEPCWARGDLTMIEVAAAVIRRGDAVLLCQRGPGKSCALLWEFPGGKIEPGETAAQCAVRECREELGVTLRILRPLGCVTHEYPDRTVRLHAFAAEIAQGEIELREHAQAAWAHPAEVANYALCPADRALLATVRIEDALL